MSESGRQNGAAASLWRILQVALTVCLVAGAGGWLLSDTIEKYLPQVSARPLRVSFWGPFQEFRMWKEMIANFRRRHPDIAVKMEYFPSRYDQKISQLMVADDAPDVMLYQDEPFPNLIESDPARGIRPKFLNLTQFASARGEKLDLDAFWSTAVELFGRWEGQGAQRTWNQYGMPVWGGCNLFYYNKECFRRVGLRVAKLPGPAGLVGDPNGPGWLLDDEQWDIDEFVEALKVLTVDRDRDGRSEQFALSMGSMVYWLPLHYAFGADILNAERTRTTFYGPEVEASLQLWQDVIYRYHVSPRDAELGQMGEGVGFFTGRVAMFCSGPWGMPFLNEAGLDYDVLHVPRNTRTRQRATRITWDAVCIGANSRKKEQAWLLVKHLASMESMRVIADVQRSIPARKEAKDYFVQVNPKVGVAKFVQAAGTYARMQPITKYWSIMERAWRDAAGEMRRDNAANRLTAREAIGRFYDDQALKEVLPPEDPDVAEEYRQTYLRRRGEGGRKTREKGGKQPTP